MADIIIVGIDGSETALNAARTAARLAAQMDSTLHIVSAAERTEFTAQDEGGVRVTTSTAEEIDRALAAAVAEVGSVAPRVQSSFISGRPADALVAEAERLEARLIVVGNRRVQGIARILGSVAATVAQHAPCDVYIVKTT